jgi:DNA-binding transcriptional regulator YiaG
MALKELPDGFGASIKRLRKHLKLTQIQLAATLEVTPHSVAQWEQEGQQPSQWSAWKLYDTALKSGRKDVAIMLASRLGETFRSPELDPERVKEVYDARQRQLRQPGKKRRGQHIVYPGFAKRLVAARQSLNLDPIQFCALHGIDSKGYADWEAGISQPSLYATGKLVKAFGRNSGFIFYEMDLMPEDIIAALPAGRSPHPALTTTTPSSSGQETRTAKGADALP